MEVVHTDKFGEWWDALSADEQEDVARVVELLRGAGVLLKFPHSSALEAQGIRYASCGRGRVRALCESYTRSTL